MTERRLTIRAASPTTDDRCRGLWTAIAAVWFFASPLTGHAAPPDPSSVGVLVIAHGGSNHWDATVRKTVKQAKLPFPTEVAFGMGMHDGDVRGFQEAVNHLQRQGVERLVVIPLLVSSNSEVFRQYEYLFGLRAEAPWPEVGKPLALQVPIMMGHTLDEAMIVAEILDDRARDLSRTPETETVILVAHGPVTEADNTRWIERMRVLADRLKERGRFHDALTMTIRDDAPSEVQARARDQLRAAVQLHSRQGRVLVIPVLIAKGGIEQKIPKLLAGLTYRYSGDPLLPDPRIAQWIAQQASRLAAVPVLVPVEKFTE